MVTTKIAAWWILRASIEGWYGLPRRFTEGHDRRERASAGKDDLPQHPTADRVPFAVAEQPVFPGRARKVNEMLELLHVNV